MRGTLTATALNGLRVDKEIARFGPYMYDTVDTASGLRTAAAPLLRGGSLPPIIVTG
jgi:hypothetical protein